VKHFGITDLSSTFAFLHSNRWSWCSGSLSC